MNIERWKQVDELIDAALELPSNQRNEFLSAKCAGDDALKAEVLSLLAARDRSDNFLETAVMDVVAKGIAADGRISFYSLIGRSISSYTIQEPIGSGGMGEIYLAHDSRLDRKVALKVLPPEFHAHPDRVKRFELESRAIALLNHPYIVTIHDVGDIDGINYIATEYIEGDTARALIERRVRPEQALKIVSQVCEALAAAHAAGVVHRDIKPENIMVRSDGFVKVLDFGLAKLNPPEGAQQALSNHTVEGTVIGTPAYMSPEQVGGDKIDPRTDLWSLGVVLYELLTGVSPFKKADRKSTFLSVLTDQPSPPSVINANVPREVDRIVLRALERDLEMRYQTAGDLLADLKGVLRHVDSSTPNGRSFTAARFGRIGPWTKPSAGLAAVVIVAVSIWYFGFRRTAAEPPDWTGATKIQLTDLPGTEMFPTLAPDGRSFIFVAKSDKGDLDLFLQRVGDKAAANITRNSSADDTQPAFSPDGERVAFRSEREPKGIFVASSTGENVRRVAEFGFHPAWSPDGREIAVSTFGKEMPDFRNSAPSEIWLVDVGTGARRLLTSIDAMQPAWSPDGKFVAFWFIPPNVGRRDVGIVPASGGDPIVITKDGTTNWNPVWSPDGKYLYFASDRGGTMGFWRVEFDDGRIISEPEPVVTPAKYSRHLALSRDGDRMIFVSTDNRLNLRTIEFDPRSEKTIGEPKWVTQGDREVIRPQLSPDGTQFVYEMSRRTQEDIVIMDRDGSNLRDLTNDAAFDRYPRWSPDSKKIVFTSDRSGIYEIWTINADGTDLRQMTFTGKKGTSFPIWSPDGAHLLYRTAPRNFILDTRQSWTDQEPAVLPDLDPEDLRRFVAWDWSPDGMHLAGSISGAPMSVGIYSLTDGRYTQLGPLGNYPAWMPDSRRFVYGFQNRIYIAGIDDKRPREVPIPPVEGIRSVGVSRDGKLIYYTIATTESDIWLLDNSTKPVKK